MSSTVNYFQHNQIIIYVLSTHDLIDFFLICEDPNDLILQRKISEEEEKGKTENVTTWSHLTM